MRMNTLSFAVALATSNLAMANDINFSATLSGQYTDNSQEQTVFEEKQNGFGLGENEIAVSGFIDKNFYGKLTAVLAPHDGEMKLEIEEAFVQALNIAPGVGARAGRFLSSVGYLNSRHIHQDNFVRRPAMYQAFFGQHYFDDGLQLNYILPTDMYVNFGVEAMAGTKLAQGHEAKNPNVTNLFAKFGDDFNASHSWQLGMSAMFNGAGAAELEDEHEVEPSEGGHEHDSHAHNAMLSGKKVYTIDGVYKWSPQGNNKYQQFTLSGEYLLADEIFAEEHEHDAPASFAGDEHGHDDHNNHQAWYVSAVYKFLPSWSAGVRFGGLEAMTAHAHDGHVDFEKGKLNETEVMLSWHASHNSSVTLQYTMQKFDNFNFEQDINGTHTEVPFNDNNQIMLQYKMNLGDHGAHAF